jgi:hypothetical protein
MHRAGGKDHRHRHIGLVLPLIGQDDVARAGAHGILRLRPDTFQPPAQRVGGTVHGEGAVDVDNAVAEMADHLIELRIGDEGAVQHEDLGLAAVLVQHVLEVAEPGLEAHHPVFAKRVDGRVRDLAEVLPEIVAERAILARQHRRRRVVAHRGQRFLPVLGHRREDLFQLLDGIARGHLAAAQFRTLEQRLFRDAARRLGQVGDLADPFPEGSRGGEGILDLRVVEQLLLLHVDGDHLARAQRALFDDGGLVHGNHPRLGARDHQTIARHDVAHRAQPVPVEPGADPAAIGHRQRRGSVPRLHHRVAVGIHVHPRLRQLRGGVRPCLGHQHRLGHRRVAARAHQDLEHRVKRGAVRRPARDDRFDVLGHLPEIRARKPDLVGFHPVDVALQRVDLAVMGQHSEGLRQPPLREGVGRIALVIDREGGLEALVLQVGIELRHLLGQHHALVDDRPAGQRTEVQFLDTDGGGGLLDPAADDVKLALEGFLVHALGIGDDDLLDLGAGRVGLLAEAGHIDRHVAPAVDVVAHPQDFGLDDRPAGFLRAEIGAGQEHLSHRHQLVLARLMPRCARPGRRRMPAGSAHGCPRRPRSCHRRPPRPGARRP